MKHSLGPRDARRATAAALTFVLSTTLVAAPVAQAQDAPASPARQLFNDARKLVSDGKYAEACPKFEESLQLEVGVGTQFNLADCWEHIGRTASAQALFLGAAASAKAAGQSEREQVLRERATALAPRLSRLVIEVEATDPKLSLKRGDLPLDSETWGKAVAVDPGKYTITARAPGKKTWEKQVEVTASTPIVTVQVPELEVAGPAKAAAAPPKPVAKKSAPAVAPVAGGADHGQGSVNYRALSVAGIGLVAIGVGTVMGIKYLNANGEAKDVCPSGQDCSIKQIQDHDRLVDEARSDRRWSYAGFGVGAAALVGAGALWYFQRPRATNSTALQAAPVLSADGTLGATLRGSF